MSDTRTPTTWDPACWPTAEQWRDWFLTCTPAEQAELAAQVVEDAQRSHDCWVMDHKGQIENAHDLAARLAATEILAARYAPTTPAAAATEGDTP